MAWARILVVGLHLCPFAEAVLDANTVRIKVSDVNNENAFSQVIHDEAQLLSKSRECDISTSLIVMPDFLPANFVRFHAACEAMEMAAEQWEDGLCDEVMIVWFHPRFCWADADGMDDVMNFDKKAPYPIVNLLRREVVDGVVRDGLAEGILGRNEERLRMMGVDKLKEAYDMLGTDGVHSL